MMGIQKLREEFEKLPDIAKRLKRIEWESELGKYRPKTSIDAFIAGWVNGAWYAFQEQKKAIDEVKAMAENWINQDYTHNSDSTDIKIQQMKDCGRDIIRKINGLSANEYREAFARQQATHQANLYISIMKKGEDE